MFKKLTDATATVNEEIEREKLERRGKRRNSIFFEMMKFLLMLQRRSSCSGNENINNTKSERERERNFDEFERVLLYRKYKIPPLEKEKSDEEK